MNNVAYLSGLALASISGILLIYFFSTTLIPKRGCVFFHVPLSLTFVIQAAVSYVLVLQGCNFQQLIIVDLSIWLCRIIIVITCYEGKMLNNITVYSVISFSYVATKVLLTPILAVTGRLTSLFYITSLDDAGYFIVVCFAFVALQIFLIIQLRKLIYITKPTKPLLWTTTVICTILNLSNLFLTSSVLLSNDTSIQTETEILRAALVIMLIVMTGATIKSTKDTKKANFEAEQSYLLSHQLEEQFKHFMELERASAELHKLKHDAANHMLTLQEMLGNESGAPKDYVNELTEKYNKASAIILCGNFIFNSQLNRIKNICAEHNIQLYYDVKIPKELEVKDIDLVGVLSNMLDNAVNACKLLSPEKRRYINICANKNIGIISIAIENSCAPNAVCNTEDRSLKHGWGIKIIKEVTQKYDGTYNLKIIKDKAFSSATMVDKLKQ